MQRVIRDSHASQDAAAALEQRVALIRQHFPPAIAHLYAIPRQGRDGVLEWWSPLEGQPHVYAELGRDQQAALLQRYEERQAAVGQLANELQQRGQTQAAGALRSLIAPPDLGNLYSINGEPLVIRWGQTVPVAAPPPPPPAPAPKPAPPAARPAPQPRPAPPPRAVPARRLRLWPWLLFGLLLALLYALWLNWPMLWARWQADHSAMCTPGAGFQASEFAVVLDTSGSMNERIRVKHADDPWYISLLAKIPVVEQFLPSGKAPTTTRLSVAKTALGAVIEDLDPKVAMRLVTFNGCKSPVDHGVFARDQRADLIDRIATLNARGGTALGVSLEAAAASMDGRERDGVIVMFVDGRDSCGTSICKVSEQIAQNQPRLRINIVNISASTGSNCAASNTGGRVYTADDAAAVAAALEQASREVSQGNGC
ncbi:VWA domain-containing protein [Pseudomonas plecoglossicida]|uniref:VWA domain-containing protein n=1 Tax=Pseudomonas plecoglossicida TaxID=70775 RepID=UPI0015E47D48|nr:VWA domain-containing protein [Pseudomonas plecoglossicida]MBA1324042.1 VWA domain-containing protein [Pseudomonas plecoglossicida]